MHVNEQHNTWMVIGSGQSVEMIRHGDFACRCIRTIGANAAIEDCRNRGVYLKNYFLSDALACLRYAERAYQARNHSGLRLWTLHRRADVLAQRDLRGFDFYLRLAPASQPLRYCPGVQLDVSYSGLHCLQIALNHGADRVLLAGMDGYGPDHPGTRDVIGPFTQSCINACPQVQFVFAARPWYPITGPNVEIFDAH